MATRDSNFFSGWLRENNWFGWAACTNGEIMDVQVARAIPFHGQQISAFECGFGSILAYLCFQNNEHHPPGRENEHIRGYNIDADLRFQQGNMPEIRDGLMYQHCRRVIYLHYNTPPMGKGYLDTRRGNKAIIYAAHAAQYNYLIAHNPNPCTEQCCGGTEGKIFQMRNILNEFNRYQPQWFVSNSTHSQNQGADPTRTRLFAEHNGFHWYFCRIDNDRSN